MELTVTLVSMVTLVMAAFVCAPKSPNTTSLVEVGRLLPSQLAAFVKLLVTPKPAVPSPPPFQMCADWRTMGNELVTGAPLVSVPPALREKRYVPSGTFTALIAITRFVLWAVDVNGLPLVSVRTAEAPVGRPETSKLAMLTPFNMTVLFVFGTFETSMVVVVFTGT